MRRALRYVVLSIALTLSPGIARAIEYVPVTTCGQVVPPKATGYLVGDLDCTGYTGGQDPAGAAVYLDFKSNLELRGFTLTGGEHGVVTSWPCGPSPLPDCARNRNAVRGPGTITGTGHFGITAWNLAVSDLTVSGYLYDVFAPRMLKATALVVRDARLNGVTALAAKLTDCSATGNARRGVDVGALLAKRGSIVGNGVGPGCPGSTVADACGDVRSRRRPRLRGTTCGTSVAAETGDPWGVCSLD